MCSTMRRTKRTKTRKRKSESVREGEKEKQRKVRGAREEKKRKECKRESSIVECIAKVSHITHNIKIKT